MDPPRPPTVDMDRAALKDKLKETGKKAINYTDSHPYINTVSSKDWLVNLLPNPKKLVRFNSINLFSPLTLPNHTYIRWLNILKVCSPFFNGLVGIVCSQLLFSPLRPSINLVLIDLGWATGDLIAGITVGLVLVPQSMSYAKIANLAPQFGLYSSFVGVFIYCVSISLVHYSARF